MSLWVLMNLYGHLNPWRFMNFGRFKNLYKLMNLLRFDADQLSLKLHTNESQRKIHEIQHERALVCAAVACVWPGDH